MQTQSNNVVAMKSGDPRLPEAARTAAALAIGGFGETMSRARQAGFMLAVMIALAIMSQFYRSSNGVIAPELMLQLGIDSRDIGWSSGSFFVIFAILQIPIRVFFDRYGVRRVLSTMLIFAVIGSLVFATAQSIGPLVTGRFLVGLGFAGGMVGSLVVLSRWHSPSGFTQAMTLLFAMANVGSLLATLPLAAANEWVGWRTTFVVLGIATGLIALLFVVIVRDAPDESADRTPRPQTLGDSLRGLREVVRVPGLLNVMPMIGIGYASVVTIVGLWGGPYLHDIYGLDGVTRGNLLSIMAVALVLGTLAYGPIQRRAGSFRPVVVIGGVASAALMLLLATVVTASLWTTVILLVAICFIGAYSVVLMAHGVALVPPELSGRGSTTLNAVLMGGTAILQIGSGEIIGLVHAWSGSAAAGYASFFLLLGVLTLVAAGIYHRAPEPPTRRPDRQAGSGDE
jgi:predicted MFS family arabinose efflux permease